MIASLLAVMLVESSLSAATQPVRAVTVDGRTVEGAWSGVDDSGAIRLLHSGNTSLLSPADLMLLRWRDPASTRPAAIQPTSIYLADGSRFMGTIVSATNRQIILRTSSVPELNLPLNRLAAIRFLTLHHEAAEEAFQRALNDRHASEDTLVLLREGRVNAIQGVTESLSADGGSFRWRNRSVPMLPENVYGLVFASGIQKPEEPQARCTLNDGSVWAGRVTGGTADQILLELADGTRIELPVADLAEIRFRSDRVLFLSDLEPAVYEFEPFGTTRWPYRTNRSVANRPMQIGKQTFDRGIGMHSRSRLEYDLPPGFTQLAAIIGVDAAVAPRGNVIFRIEADDKEIFNSGPVTGRDAPRTILVPIKDATRLALAIEFGEELDIADQANWASIRLIK